MVFSDLLMVSVKMWLPDYLYQRTIHRKLASSWMLIKYLHRFLYKKCIANRGSSKNEHYEISLILPMHIDLPVL